jgi:glycosyltransferase involved in cell wall biosynthesis
MIGSARKLHKKQKVDAVICYEPMFTGVIGVILKIMLGCKLIIELNSSNLAEAIITEGKGSLKARVKGFVCMSLRGFSLFFADGIKLLTRGQEDSLEEKYKKKVVVCFHDYVPTHFFKAENPVFEKSILFIGFPFHRKGIDLLIKAFEALEKQHPSFSLRLIGYLIEGEAKEILGSWSERVKFIKPMYYEELKEEFSKCYCLVLPSREEGMGRVLLEAMASSKPVIGANVGGIPDLVEDGVNGYLFEREDIEGLSQKLNALLSDEPLARLLGKGGEKTIEEKFSSQRYCEYFKAMIAKVID